MNRGVKNKMEKKNINIKPSTTYRVEGFSCANCAAKFEDNVRSIEGVTEVKVNFGAAKITVEGQVTRAQLEQAGKFENLKLYNEHDKIAEPVSIWKQRETHKVILSAVLFILGSICSAVIPQLPILSTMVFAIAIVVGGYSLFFQGVKQLIRLKFDMTTLMTIAIMGAAAIGEWSEGAIVVILFAISEALESYSMHKARSSLSSLVNLAPKQAYIRRNDTTLLINVEDIAIDDIMLVKPGQKLAMDGIVVTGHSTVNQATITGESLPIAKTVGDEVYAGTLNEEGLLEVKVTKHVHDTTLAKIIHMVEEAQAEKAPTQAFIDRFAKYYTPAIILIATFIAIFPPLLFSGDWKEWLYRGLSILVVGCPCALVISTPIAIVTAIGHAAKQGVLIKGGVYLEETAKLQVIAFDKTGTLTKGVPHVTDIICLQDTSERKALKIVAAIENGSQHPLASAIIQKADQLNLGYRTVTVTNFKSITGKGIRADIDGITYYIGSPILFEEQLPTRFDKALSMQLYALQKEAKTVVLFGTEQSVLAIIAIADEVRPNAKTAIMQLHDLDIEETIMLTGDNHATAQVVSNIVGLSSFHSDLLPEHKLDLIKALQNKHKHIAMVGDGVNDAPSLASANIGIAMGGAGTDAALETANVVLMSDDLLKLPYTIKLSRKAMAIIKQNVTFALTLKLLALCLIIPGWLNMWLAIFADMGATLIVLVNSLRLIKQK